VIPFPETSELQHQHPWTTVCISWHTCQPSGSQETRRISVLASPHIHELPVYPSQSHRCQRNRAKELNHILYQRIRETPLASSRMHRRTGTPRPEVAQDVVPLLGSVKTHVSPHPCHRTWHTWSRVRYKHSSIYRLEDG
jgi:hypothetical protein